MSTRLATLVGPEGAARVRLASDLAAVGWQVECVDAPSDPAPRLAELAPDVVLMGPLDEGAATWEPAAIAAASQLRIPVIAFGPHAGALGRLGTAEGVIGLLPSPWPAEGAAVVVDTALARHHRDTQAKERLETSLALLDAILHEAPLTIYAKDPQMRFLWSNRRHSELVGRPAEEVLGRTDVDLFGREGVALDAVGRKVFQTGRAESSEFELELRGQAHVFQEVIFPIAQAGRRVGIAGIATDLTEVRRQQALLSERVEELDRSRRISALTSECVELVQRCISIEESLELTSRFLSRMYPDANVAIYERLDANAELTLRTQARRFGEFAPRDSLEVQDCWAMRMRRVYAVRRGASRIPCRHLASSGEDCACAPLLSMDRVVGLVSLEMPPVESRAAADTDRIARWTAQLETTIQSLAGALSTVTLRESLHHNALVDELTKLPNQRAFLAAIQKGLARARRAREAAVVAVFDLSHPQLAGGVWGHEESERLLRQVAELALAFFRVDDTVARLGTAEFGVVMTMKNAEDAEPRLAAFREEASHRCRSGQSAVAISVGFCVVEPGAAGTPEQLSLLAEQALRDAKSHERRLARRELERLLLHEPGHEQPR